MVYLLHFSRPLHHACHYIGFCADSGLYRRLKRHRRGNGARLLRACNLAGIGYVIARRWPGADRAFERRLKRRKNAAQLCPVCNPGLKKTLRIARRGVTCISKPKII